MRYLLALFLILLAPLAPLALAEDRIARQGDDWVRLTDKPCTSDAVRARLLPDSVDEWRAATAQFQGQTFSACWREVRGAAYLVYEDGDQGMVPAKDMKPAPMT